MRLLATYAFNCSTKLKGNMHTTSQINPIIYWGRLINTFLLASYILKDKDICHNWLKTYLLFLCHEICLHWCRLPALLVKRAAWDTCVIIYVSMYVILGREGCILECPRKHHLECKNFYHPFSCSIWSNLSDFFFEKIFNLFFYCG